MAKKLKNLTLAIILLIQLSAVAAIANAAYDNLLEGALDNLDAATTGPGYTDAEGPNMFDEPIDTGNGLTDLVVDDDPAATAAEEDQAAIDAFSGDTTIEEGETIPENTGTSSKDTGTTMPSIPKSDLLPGPNANSNQTSIQTYFRTKALPDFISGFVGIVGVAAFISLLIAGIQFLTAYGNDEKIGSAKKTATYAIIGFIIAIFSYTIVSIISSLPISTDETASIFSIPTAYAVTNCSDPSKLTADQKPDCLLPSETNLIESSPNSQGASLPSGDLIEDTIPKVVKVILYAVSLAVLASIVYAGILLVIARGNEEDIKKAENMLLYSAIGVIIIGMAYALVYGLSQLNI